VTVRARTIDGSATAPADYAAVDTVVSFAPGELVKSVSVTTATDALAEPAESLGVALSEAAGASVARDALVTIADRAGTAGGGTSGSTDGAGTGTKTPAAGVTIGAGTLRLDKHGRMHVALACPAEPTAPACRGTLTVASAAKVRVGKKRSILDLGKATFTIPRGATVKVAVTLSHRNLLVVRRLHSLRVALVAGDTRRVVPLFRYAKGG
jgi:hypothetical protein